MSIGEALKISGRQTSQDTHNVTFSQALAGGLTHYDWLNGPKTDLCGRDHALASHSVLPEREKGDKISGTCGRLLDGLSKSASLQLSLENRLRESLDANGSQEYEMTWLSWDMPSGPPICRLRALAPRTSGRDYCGWPTPETAKGGQTSRSGKRKKELLIGGIVRGFATPRASDHKPGTSPGPAMREAQRKCAQNDLGTTAAMFHASTGNTEGYRLNPYFSLWLMGYPIEWGYLGARAIQLYRN